MCGSLGLRLGASQFYLCQRQLSGRRPSLPLRAARAVHRLRPPRLYLLVQSSPLSFSHISSCGSDNPLLAPTLESANRRRTAPALLTRLAIVPSLPIAPFATFSRTIAPFASALKRATSARALIALSLLLPAPPPRSIVPRRSSTDPLSLVESRWASWLWR